MMNKTIEDAKKGNQKAFNTLYKKLYKDIHRTILYTIKDEVVAQEITNDAFIKAFDSLDKFENISFKMWLKTIATNKCIDYFRKKKKNTECVILDTEENGIKDKVTDGKNIETEITDMESKEFLKEIIENLYYKHRNLLKNRYYENMSYSDLASYYDVDEGTVKSNLNKAHKALRESYIQTLTKLN
jgi:RNA polymerase sigma-70 factor (ECF subfamily)